MKAHGCWGALSAAARAPSRPFTAPSRIALITFAPAVGRKDGGTAFTRHPSAGSGSHKGNRWMNPSTHDSLHCRQPSDFYDRLIVQRSYLLTQGLARQGVVGEQRMMPKQPLAGHGIAYRHVHPHAQARRVIATRLGQSWSLPDKRIRVTELRRLHLDPARKHTHREPT